MVRTWQITKTRLKEVSLKDPSSLDAVTRRLVPDGYYSTFRTYGAGTRVIGLSAHLKRLPNADAATLRRNLVRALEPYRPGEARVRIMQSKQGACYISMEPLTPLPSEVYEKGVHVETTSLQRNDPRVKSTAFIGASAEERSHLAQHRIFEALLVKNGKILEGLTSNFFYVAAGILYTARSGILLGVTRSMVIRAARGRGVEVRYISLKVDQVPAVDEAFITSSSRGIVPVVGIDDLIVGKGRPGKTTRKLASAYDDYVLSHAERIR